MAEPSDDTKKTASSMFSRVGKSALGGAKKVASSVGKLFTKKPENVIPHPSGPTETLGEIFKMMKLMDEDKKLNQEMASAHIEEQKHEKDKRNNEIIKALTSRKPPKPPRLKKEKKVVEEKAPPEKKPPEKKVEEKTKEDKVTKDKAAKETKQTETKDKKSKETADKVKQEEEKKSRDTADKVKKEEEAKKAKDTADKVKKEEVAKKAEKPVVKAEKPAEVIPQVAKKVPPITGTDSAIKKMIMEHEGKINFPYKDSKGLWTIGVGHLIGDGKTLPPEYAAYKDNGGPNDKKNNRTPAMTDEQVNELFEKDYAKHKEIAIKTPGWNLANESGQSAMIDLSYNMGAWYNTEGWKNSRVVKALKAGDFNAAADNLKDSKWYEQVKGRAVKIVDMMRNGRKTDAELAKNTPTSGVTIDQSSKTNADMKKDINAQQLAMNQQNVNIINQNTTQPEQTIPPKSNDTNPLLAKVKGQAK
jgi:GH24 family phage-related lysozyme (muramidase)